MHSNASRFFPAAHSAGRDGLIAVGGSLTPDWLLDAYRHGIFPWPMSGILAWWSPDPRAVIEFENLHVSRRLQRTLTANHFRVTCDHDFSGVINGCATAQDRAHGTWLTTDLREAYIRLHRLGHAHSVEVWQETQLVGGTYGVAVGGMFAAESMFYKVSDASKVALVRLVRHLEARGYELLDIQQLTRHTARFGATEIPRRQYLSRLRHALTADVTFGRTLEGM
ncbi:MAG: leucyl/phenylalanyl-tRNA--protein transferase [Pirellulales bacterium]|nr:leucyl/phenylalanyl-tRNA--protein transferase [Pirellulales bacterium]